jgi:hypothetical protein
MRDLSGGMPSLRAAADFDGRASVPVCFWPGESSMIKAGMMEGPIGVLT